MHAHLTSSTVPDLLPMQGRSPGVHVSRVTSYLAGYSTTPPSMIAQGRMLLGKALEWALLSMYRADVGTTDDYYSPGELCLDNIYGTPDLGRWQDDDSRRQITEIKLTWGRAPPEPSDPTDDPAIDSLDTYLIQLKSYCRMANTLRGRLVVCYVGGFADVHWREWDITFEQMELEINWAMVVSVADHLRKEKQ